MSDDTCMLLNDSLPCIDDLKDQISILKNEQHEKDHQLRSKLVESSKLNETILNLKSEIDNLRLKYSNLELTNISNVEKLVFEQEKVEKLTKESLEKDNLLNKLSSIKNFNDSCLSAGLPDNSMMDESASQVVLPLNNTIIDGTNNIMDSSALYKELPSNDNFVTCQSINFEPINNNKDFEKLQTDYNFQMEKLNTVLATNEQLKQEIEILKQTKIEQEGNWQISMTNLQQKIASNDEILNKNSNQIENLIFENEKLKEMSVKFDQEREKFEADLTNAMENCTEYENLCKDLRGQIENCKVKFDKMCEENLNEGEILNEKIRAEGEANKMLSDQVDDLNNELYEEKMVSQEIKSQTDILQTKNANLQKEAENFQNIIQTNEKVMENLKMTIDSFTKEISNKDHQIEDLKSQITSNDESYNDLENEMKNLQLAADNNQILLQQSESKIKLLQECHQDVEKQNLIIENLKTNLEFSEAKTKEMDEALTQLLEEKAALELSIEKLEKISNENKEQLLSKQSDIDDLQAENNSKTKEFQTLLEKLDKSNVEFLELQKIISQLETESKDKEQIINEKEQQLIKIQNDANVNAGKLYDQIQEQKKNVSSQENVIEDLKSEILKYKEAKNELEELILVAEEKLIEKDLKLTTADGLLTEKTRELNEEIELNKTRTQEVESLNLEKESLLKNLSLKDKEIQSKTIELKQKEDEKTIIEQTFTNKITELNLQLLNKANTIVDLKNDFDELKKKQLESEQSHSQMSESNNEILNAKNLEISNLNENVSKLNEQLSCLKSENDQKLVLIEQINGEKDEKCKLVDNLKAEIEQKIKIENENLLLASNLTSKNEQLEHDLENFRTKNENLNENLAKMQEEMASKTQNNDELIKNIEQLKLELKQKNDGNLENEKLIEDVKIKTEERMQKIIDEHVSKHGDFEMKCKADFENLKIENESLMKENKLLKMSISANSETDIQKDKLHEEKMSELSQAIKDDKAKITSLEGKIYEMRLLHNQEKFKISKQVDDIVEEKKKLEKSLNDRQNDLLESKKLYNDLDSKHAEILIERSEWVKKRQELMERVNHLSSNNLTNQMYQLKGPSSTTIASIGSTLPTVSHVIKDSNDKPATIPVLEKEIKRLRSRNERIMKAMNETNEKNKAFQTKLKKYYDLCDKNNLLQKRSDKKSLKNDVAPLRENNK